MRPQGTATKRPDNAILRIVVFTDDSVELAMFRDGDELGHVTVPMGALLMLLGVDADCRAGGGHE